MSMDASLVNTHKKDVDSTEKRKSLITFNSSKIVDFVFHFFVYSFAFIWIIPLVWLTITAFQPKEMATSLGLAFRFTLENFRVVLKSAPFGQYYLNTFIIVFSNLFIQLITSTFAAYAFARLNFKGKNILFMVVLLQLMIPNDVLIFPNYQTLGMIGWVDKKIGIMAPYFGSAFAIFLLRQMFKTIPSELEEAGVLDGCNILQIIWHIFVPLAKPTYVAFGLVSVSYHWNNFLWPLIVTNSVENRPLTVGLAIFAKSYETGAMWAEVSAATFMVILPLILGFFIFQKQFISSFIQSGIK